jgi:hypothetical protein
MMFPRVDMSVTTREAPALRDGMVLTEPRI